MRTIGVALLAANLIVASAEAEDCVRPADLSALRTAAIQQELMVSAFSCRDIARYNHFVLAHQSELIDSDARLKAFFVRRNATGGEKMYHTFKTDLANTASLRSIRETEAFCGEAGAAFDLAEQPMSLTAFVAVRPLPLAATYEPCDDGERGPVMAQASAELPAPRAELFGEEKNYPSSSTPGAVARVSPRSDARTQGPVNDEYSAAPPALPPHRDLEEDYRPSDVDAPRDEGRDFHSRRSDVPLWARVRRALVRDYRYDEGDRYRDRPSDWRDYPPDEDRDYREP